MENHPELMAVTWMKFQAHGLQDMGVNPSRIIDNSELPYSHTKSEIDKYSFFIVDNAAMLHWSLLDCIKNRMKDLVSNGKPTILLLIQ